MAMSCVTTLPNSTGVFSIKARNKSLAHWSEGKEQLWQSRRVKTSAPLQRRVCNIEALPAKAKARILGDIW